MKRQILTGIALTGLLILGNCSNSSDDSDAKTGVPEVTQNTGMLLASTVETTSKTKSNTSSPPLESTLLAANAGTTPSIPATSKQPKAEVGSAAETSNSTDVFWGEIFMSSDGQPQNVKFLRVSSWPGVWETIDVSKPSYYEELQRLTIELRDNFGEAVHTSEFVAHPDFQDTTIAEFFIRIPNPPAYESIVVIKSNEELGVVDLSPNPPIVKITNPVYGSVFCYEDALDFPDGTNLVELLWNGFDPDEENLRYGLWHSIDGGETYKRLRLYDNTFYPNYLFEVDKVHVRIYVTDGTRTAFDETYFELDTEICSEDQKQQDSNGSLENNDLLECNSYSPSDTVEMLRETEVITGNIWLSDGWDPISLEFDKISSIPNLRYPRKLIEGYSPILTIDLLDASGITVLSSQFEAGPLLPGPSITLPGQISSKWEIVAGFIVYIPDPPDYDSIVIIDDMGNEIGRVARSSNAPFVKINEPKSGSILSYEDSIKLSWSGCDPDGERLEYDFRYSIDGGETYDYAALQDDNSFHPVVLDRFFESKEVLLRVSVTDGTRTAFDEVYFTTDLDQ